MIYKNLRKKKFSTQQKIFSDSFTLFAGGGREKKINFIIFLFTFPEFLLDEIKINEKGAGTVRDGKVRKLN